MRRAATGLRTIPRNVDAPVFAQRNMRPANRAHGNRAAGDLIHLHRLGKFPVASRHIINIRRPFLAREKNNVSNALRVGDDLRLFAVHRQMDERNFRCRQQRAGKEKGKESGFHVF